MTDMMSWDWNSVELAMPTDEPMVVTDETSRLVLSDGACLSSLVRRLQITGKHFARDPLWEELWLLSRLIYRNNSQHRRAVFFQKLLQIQKQLKRYQTIGLAASLSNLALYFPSGKDLATKPFDRLLFPSRNTVRFTMTRLQGAAKLAVQTIRITEEVSRILLHMVAKTEFMPFVVTMLTLLSRVRLLLIAQVHEMSDVFTALAQCERVLPGEKSFYPSTQWPQILLEWAGLGRDEVQRNDQTIKETVSSDAVADLEEEQTSVVAIDDMLEDLGEVVMQVNREESAMQSKPQPLKRKVLEHNDDIDDKRDMAAIGTKKKKKKKLLAVLDAVKGDTYHTTTTVQPIKQPPSPYIGSPKITSSTVSGTNNKSTTVPNLLSKSGNEPKPNAPPCFWLNSSERTDVAASSTKLSSVESLKKSKKKKKKKAKPKDKDDDDDLDRLFDMLE